MGLLQVTGRVRRPPNLHFVFADLGYVVAEKVALLELGRPVGYQPASRLEVVVHPVPVERFAGVDQLWFPPGVEQLQG